jgi:hypothetical protein
MRKIILLASMILPATLLLAQGAVQPLDVKTGSWDVTMTTNIDGMNGPQSRTYRSCLRKEDLNKYPFTDSDRNCTYKVVTSTGKTMEAHGTCQPASEGMKIDFDLHLNVVDSGTVNGTGSMTMNLNGRTMNGKYSASAKWLSDTCTK